MTVKPNSPTVFIYLSKEILFFMLTCTKSVYMICEKLVTLSVFGEKVND